ncbi:MAG: hypothetical protein EAX96_21115 [Candidatus Lokiarchaeota archaeon]|nr:hypothetical protein [Candidatus Lokiarchaeota archaeon]
MEILNSMKYSIKLKVIRHRKDTLLEWLSATSILPGNEFFQFRFMFLKQFVLSIPNSEFQNNNITCKEFGSIIADTNIIDWSCIEDWTPISNTKLNEFGLNGDLFYFLAGNLEIPENNLKKIVTRFFEFDDIIKEKYDYSIKAELNKILQYQTNIIKFLDQNKNLDVHEFKQFIIPSEQFIQKWIIILNKKSTLSNRIWKNNINNFPEPNSIHEPDEFFTANPIIDDKIYTPYILLVSFNAKITSDLKKIINKEIRQELRKQLEKEVLISISELVPNEAIFNNLSVGKNNGKMDFGFINDNKCFLFTCLEETFNVEHLNKCIGYIQNNYLNIEKEFEKNNKIELIAEHDSFIIKENFDLIFLIIIDDLEDKVIYVENIIGKNFVILSYDCLNHIFEDLAENKQIPIYFSKIIEKSYSFKKFVSFDLCNFYDFFTHGGEYLKVSSCEHPVNVINPHLWSNNHRRKIIETRPMIDLQPYDGEKPYTYKILRISDNTYYGYNKILNVEFYCYKNDIEIYILTNINKLKSNEEREIAPFISEFLKFYIEELFNDDLINSLKKDKIIIEIIPHDWAIKYGNIDTMSSFPLLVGIDDDENYTIIVDPPIFAKEFNLFSKNILRYIFDTIIKGIVSEIQFEKLDNRFQNLDPSKSFKISEIVTPSNSNWTMLFYPTNLDFIDLENDLFINFNERISAGIYEGNEAKEIINQVYDYLVKNLLAEISRYDILNFVLFSYSQVENCFKEKKYLTLHFRLSQDTSTDHDSNIIRENEFKIQKYSLGCRYLLEQAVLQNISGTEKLNINEWQNIIPVAMKILDLANISDYLHRLPDFFDIKLKIEAKSGLFFDIIIEDNPMHRHMDYYVKGLETLDMSRFLYSEEKVKDDPDKLREFLEEKKFKILNDELEKTFGFRLYNYIIVLNMLTNFQNQINEFGIIKILLSNVIDFIHEKMGFDKELIKTVINFSTINIEGSKGEIIEPWRVNSRENRLTIKPIIQIKDFIIFAPEFLIMAEENVASLIMDGKWPYQRNLLPRHLQKALDRRQKEVSGEFEKFVYEEIKKYSDFAEINIYKRKGGNDKCLIEVDESCPGEIDVLSIHKEKKTLILWEVKDIEQKFGAREIVSDSEDFLNIKKGYIAKLKRKEEYLKRNINSILKYYNIVNEEWKVISCIVLSSDIIVKSILEKRYNIINFNEIPIFLEK